MKNVLKFLFAALILNSCGSTDTTTDSKENDTTSITVDTLESLPELPGVDLNLLLSKCEATTSFPIKVDSAYLSELSELESEPLNRDEVVFLSQFLIETEFYYSKDYLIANFLLIDSLKSIDKYDGYVDTLDLGETKEADAFIIDKIILDDSTSLLLWYMYYSTYEACPYGYGTYLFASILHQNKIISCAQLGEDSGGGDAPYWGSTLTTFNLSKTGAKINKITANGGDEDEEGNEIVERTSEKFELILVDNVWKVKQ